MSSKLIALSLLTPFILTAGTIHAEVYFDENGQYSDWISSYPHINTQYQQDTEAQSQFAENKQDYPELNIDRSPINNKIEFNGYYVGQ